MPFAASHSQNPDVAVALDEVCQQVTSQLDADPDLSFVFVSHDHAAHFDTLAESVCSRTGSRFLLGCTGETIVGADREMESGPAISLWSGLFPETRIEAFHAQFSQTPDGIVVSGLPDFSSLADDPNQTVFLLGEPFTSAPQSVIDRLAEESPGVPLLGGMASGAVQPGENRLFLNSATLDAGAVGVLLSGGPRIRSVISQGCRPIGTHFVVTKAEQNVVFELGGKPPLRQLEEFLPELPDRDQALVRQGLHLGIVMNEYQETFRRGDFLISNVIGADPDRGAIAVGNHVRVGQTVQFHVRDAQTADEDLTELLQHDRTDRPPAQAGLLFSCNGRGTRLFPEPHHDARTIQQIDGPLPLAGFFAQGELGPVADHNHIHGFTASVALFE